MRAKVSKVLLIHADTAVSRQVGQTLNEGGFSVEAALDLKAALALSCLGDIGLILLDWNYDGIDGAEILRTLKRTMATANLPVIILAKNSTDTDRIVALELGAEDFLTEPICQRELLLRVGIVGRRACAYHANGTQVAWKEIIIDKSRFQATVRGKSLGLTVTEFRLLLLLVRAEGKPQARETLITEVWASDPAIDARTVDTHIRRLRKKLGVAARGIQTVRGVGYAAR